LGSIKELMREAPVHERNLQMRTYPLDDGRLIAEGWLRDERFTSGFHWSGKPRPHGVVHWICVRLLLEGWPLRIVDAEAEMPDIPHEKCPTTLPSLENIIGITIESGFSAEIIKRIGGVKGCTHMTHLIVAMGPAALHGYWTQKSREPGPPLKSIEEYEGLPYLINSCRLWREDGPIMKEFRELLGKQA